MSDIFRHPVKGLAPEPLQEAQLQKGQPLPWDRKYAITHGASRFDLENPTWIKRNNFLVVALSPKLATIKSRLDDRTGLYHVSDKAGQSHSLRLEDKAGQAKLYALAQTYAGAGQAGPYRLVTLKSGHLADRNKNALSLHNTASLKAVEATSGLVLSKRRWRGNLWFEGLSAFEEFNWIGRVISIGAAKLRVMEPIERCAATSANPTSGLRDINMPSHLYKTYGHRSFGVLAEVVEGGAIRPGISAQVL